ncbi:hypothetical protein ACLQ2R_17540 [Streptosporangium sp. DT93]|uniref:hypothetical protein n=1 Tax=Streptosporangium sp. DT93 TaxID=3393428 RepID=UPI003CF69695
MGETETPVEWLERQAAAYHDAHQDPALCRALPPVPAYLRQPGGQEAQEEITTTTVDLPSGATARITHRGPITPSTLVMLDDTARDMMRRRDEAGASRG